MTNNFNPSRFHSFIVHETRIFLCFVFSKASKSQYNHRKHPTTSNSAIFLMYSICTKINVLVITNFDDIITIIISVNNHCSFAVDAIIVHLLLNCQFFDMK